VRAAAPADSARHPAHAHPAAPRPGTPRHRPPDVLRADSAARRVRPHAPREEPGPDLQARVRLGGEELPGCRAGAGAVRRYACRPRRGTGQLTRPYRTLRSPPSGNAGSTGWSGPAPRASRRRASRRASVSPAATAARKSGAVTWLEHEAVTSRPDAATTAAAARLRVR